MSSTSTISYANNNVITHNAGIITSAIPNQSNYNSASDNSLAPVAYSFSLSLILLLIVSYQKYHMDKVNNSNDYCLFFLAVTRFTRMLCSFRIPAVDGEFCTCRPIRFICLYLNL